MGKDGSFIVGALSSSVIAGIVAVIVSRDSTVAFIVGVAYLAFCGVGAVLFAGSARVPKVSKLSAREIFWMPFVPFFLSPLLLAAAAVVYEWKIDQPAVRYGGIVAGLLLTGPALWLHRRFSEPRRPVKRRPNPTPTPTPTPGDGTGR